MARKKKTGGPGGIIRVIAAALITVIVGIVLISRYGDKLSRPAPVAGQREITLYVVARDGIHLTGIRRTIKRGRPEDELGAALESLINGPRSAAAATPIPRGTRLLGVRVDGDTAIADFSERIIKGHGGGATGELLTVYSIVDTLVLNFPAINHVRILVSGRSRPTLAGHVEIDFALDADRKIIINK